MPSRGRQVAYIVAILIGELRFPLFYCGSCQGLPGPESLLYHPPSNVILELRPDKGCSLPRLDMQELWTDNTHVRVVLVLGELADLASCLILCD